MIIDAHAHLGFDDVFDHDFTEAALIESQRVNGIGLTLVQPASAHDLGTVRILHDAIGALARRYPGRFRGIANPNPHLAASQYVGEVHRCIEDLGFVGVKMHPTAHAVNPVGRCGRRVFAAASELGVPVMVHTGAGIPWSAPSLLGPIAVEYPTLPIVIAHSGMMVLSGEAEQLAERCPNVYLECTWTPGFLVRAWADRFGAERLMYGSDHAENAATELAKVRTAGLSSGEVEWVLGRTAAKVFGVPSGGASDA